MMAQGAHGPRLLLQALLQDSDHELELIGSVGHGPAPASPLTYHTLRAGTTRPLTESGDLRLPTMAGLYKSLAAALVVSRAAAFRAGVPRLHPRAGLRMMGTALPTKIVIGADGVGEGKH